MGTVTINGVTYSGNSITVSGNRVIIDGKSITPDSKEIIIVVRGDIEKLEVDACNKISVVGNVGIIKTVSGDVEVTGSVDGSVQTVSGDVGCGIVGGSIKTVSGNIKTIK